MRVLAVSKLAAIGREIKLIPPRELRFGGQRLFVGCPFASGPGRARGEYGMIAVAPRPLRR